MKLTALVLSFLMFSTTAFASGFAADDDKILDQLDEIATEINTWNHKDKAMKFSYRKLSRIEMKLKKQRGKIMVPNPVTDDDILDLLEAIATEIEDNDHKQRRLNITSFQLKTVNRVLVKRRTSMQESDVAILELSDADPFDFGTSVVGESSSFTFVITNQGTAAATNILSGVNAPFGVTGGTCTTIVSLAVNDSCFLMVTFAPTTAGTFSQILEVQYFNGVDTDLTTKELQGQGI